MLIGAGSWIVLHLVFIGVALPSHSYSLMLASYMLRGMGYPLFIYSFVVLLAQTVDPGKLASAMLVLDFLFLWHRCVWRLSAGVHHAGDW